jgi:ubiquinone/menaquinone biosynthesis C-methylase UbiE
MRQRKREYIFALHYDWLTSLYDPIVKWTTRENTFKSALLRYARIKPAHRVLDLGCGTGTLTMVIKKAVPPVTIVGCDGDRKILDLAREKASKVNLEIPLSCGMAYELPYPEHSFDRVVSSFLLHHLAKENKLRTLAEVFRVLKPGGELHLADWGKAQNKIMRMAFLVIQLLDGFQRTSENVRGFLIQYLRDTGFEAVEETHRFMTVWGTLSLYKALKRA